MKKVWKCAAACARVGERLLNVIIELTFITALLFGIYGIYDTICIYRGAALSSDIKQYKPVDTGDDTPNPTLEELQSINADVCAWLTVDDTNIDYPIVQGRTNLEYLNKAVDGSFSLSGSLFLDCYNSRDFSDRYSIIYGHHMDGNAMFGQIPNFLEEDYLDSHQTGEVFTVENTYHIEWFACLETDAYDKNIYNPPSYWDDASVAVLLDYIEDIAVTYRDIGMSSSDRLIALSTCSDMETDGRIVLVGRIEK
jgi:sortase B